MNENLDLTKGFKTRAIVTSFALTNYSIIHTTAHSFILMGSYSLHEKNFPDLSRFLIVFSNQFDENIYIFPDYLELLCIFA